MIGSISSHIGRNLWVWAGLGLVVGGVAMLASTQAGKGNHFGDLGCLALMFAGATLCIISQKDMPRAVAEDDDAA